MIGDGVLCRWGLGVWVVCGLGRLGWCLLLLTHLVLRSNDSRKASDYSRAALRQGYPYRAAPRYLQGSPHSWGAAIACSVLVSSVRVVVCVVRWQYAVVPKG